MAISHMAVVVVVVVVSSSSSSSTYIYLYICIFLSSRSPNKKRCNQFELRLGTSAPCAVPFGHNIWLFWVHRRTSIESKVKLSFGPTRRPSASLWWISLWTSTLSLSKRTKPELCYVFFFLSSLLSLLLLLLLLFGWSVVRELWRFWCYSIHAEVQFFFFYCC